MADYVTDAFTEASDVALESHTPDVGPAWAKYTVAGTTGMHVNSATDKATCDSSTSSSFYLSTYDPATDSYDIEVVINVSNFATAFSGIIFGADPSANTFYQVFFNSATNIRLQRIVSGATTVVKSVTGSWSTATDYKWRLSRRGNAFALYVDDVKVFNVKDSNITIPGRCGIRGRSTGTFDNFRLLDAEISPQNEVTTNGIWCWFTNPRALYDATNDCYYWGVVDTVGDIEVWKLDSNNVITGFDLIRAFEQDDHDHPGILILPSGKLVAFYSKHIDASSDTRYRITTSAGDVTAWGIEQTMTQAANPTYSHPFYMSGPDEVVVLYRGGLGDQYMNTADATISSWGTEQQIIDANGKRPYVIYEQNGPNRIDCLCTDQHPDLGASSVYHWYLEHDGSVWRRYKSDGTEITASMPWRVDLQATLIYDGSTTYGWIWDLRIDGSGNPHVLFTKFPSTTDHRLMYTKWTGSAWATPVEVAAQGTYLYLGQPHYSGGASFDGNDLSIVYLAAHGGTGYHEAQVWETADGGSTWSKTADITTGSSQTNARPVSPVGHDGRLACLWWAADYTAYDNYDNASILRYENVTSSGATTYTLTAGTGAFTTTGVSAGLKASRAISGGVGSFTTTGVSAGLVAARKISAGVGSFTTTGYAADLVYTPVGGPTYTLAAGVGAFTTTGISAGLVAARKLSAGIGAFTTTGYDAILTKEYVLTAGIGSFTTTGVAASLVASRVLIAGTGSFSTTCNPLNFYLNQGTQEEEQAFAGSWWGKQWLRMARRKDKREEQAKEAYQEIKLEAPPDIKQKAKEIIAPFKQDGVIEWDEIANDVETVRKLIKLANESALESDDEEVLML